MAYNCPSSVFAQTDADASLNVTKLLLQRYQDSPKDDWDRLVKCWGYLDCGDCHRSDGFCGWCPISSTCLPLPTDPLSRAFPLLSPIRYKSICALGSERFELRTLGLGCQVSTITFLTSVITIFSTLVGVLVLWSLFTCTKGVHRGLRALKGGYMVYPTDEQFKGQVWARKGDSWLRPWKVLGGKQRIFRLEETDTGSRNEIRTWRGRQQSRNIVIQGMEVSPLLPDQRGYGA